MTKLTWTGLMAVAILGLASPVLAHHSHAMFDHTRETTVTGTVKEFVFRNPHVYLYVEAKNDRGELVTYAVEMSNIPNMIRQGITQSTFKVGEAVTVTVHPLRDGRPGGDYSTLKTADGKTFDRDSDTQ
jgi:uncharacterized protein DUF6152